MATTFLVVKNRAVSTLNGGINQSNTIDESGINFENLNANEDVGTGASQVSLMGKMKIYKIADNEKTKELEVVIKK